MHTLHLAVTMATSPEEACEAVHGYVQGYGGESNYYGIEGCVSQDDEIYLNEKDVSWLDDELNTIKKLTETVKGWIFSGGLVDHDKCIGLMDNARNGEKLKPHEWWEIKMHAEHNQAVSRLEEPGRFNILKDTFKEYVYDDSGVTRMYCKDTGLGEDEKYYVVFINMHT
jgi:hypothetical protein